jgi:hypothetical protein
MISAQSAQHLLNVDIGEHHGRDVLSAVGFVQPATRLFQATEPLPRAPNFAEFAECSDSLHK